MAKERTNVKEGKKKPLLTPKERKELKRAKKAERQVAALTRAAACSAGACTARTTPPGQPQRRPRPAAGACLSPVHQPTSLSAICTAFSAAPLSS